MNSKEGNRSEKKKRDGLEKFLLGEKGGVYLLGGASETRWGLWKLWRWWIGIGDG